MNHEEVTLVAHDMDTLASVDTPGGGAEAGSLEPGTQLGRYVILERVGAGGMGTVYAAFDPELDRKIAVKVLSSNYGSDTRADNGARRLRREAQALARLQHPNVIPIYDVGSFEGRVYLAMAFVDGQTLGKWAKERPRSLDEVLDVFEQAGRGLSAAHASGLVHRDFKPDNVMIDRKGAVFVMDFGLARTSAEDERSPEVASEVSDESTTEGGSSSGTTAVTLSEKLTRAGAAAGTPAYMAPEQHLGQELDAHTDQFSLCVTLWEVLYGERPFGTSSSGGSLAFGLRVIEGKIVEPADPSKVPSHIRTALERGLRPAAADRWPSIGALFAALRDDPRQRWRRGGLVAAAGLLVAMGFGSWHYEQAKAVERCELQASAISGRWKDAKGEIEKAFAGAAEDGAETFAIAEPWVNDWVRDAAELRSRECIRELQGGEAEQAQARQSLSCVDERADEVGALIELWRKADTVTLRKAVASATRLPALARCSDAAWLSRRPEPPQDPELRARISQVRHQLADLNALISAGRYDAGLEAANALLPDAESIGWDPLTTDVLHKQAELVQRTGDYKQAAKDLAAVYRRAVINGDDDVALDVLGRLIPLLAYHLSQPEEASWWAQQADTLILRLGERGGIQDASIQFTLGTVAHMQGDSDTALEHFETSLDIYRRRLGPKHPNTIGLTNNVGLIHEQAERREQALEAYRAAREGFIGLYGELHPDVGTATNNIGSVLFALGRIDEAYEAYEDAVRIRRLTLGENHPEVAATLHNLAVVASRRGDPKGALAFHRQALSVRERVFGPEHAETAFSLDSIGATLRALGRHSESLEYHERALAIRLAHHGGEHESVGQSHQSLAYAYIDLNRPEDALEAAETALRIKEASKLGPVRRAHAYAARSLAHSAMRHPAEALADAETCLELRRRALGVDHPDTVAAQERVESLRPSKK
jgi:serine/threonine protein kinase/Tfp pilus assembly protein PilF